MSLAFTVVNRTSYLGAVRPIIARLHHDHVTVRNGQLHHVGGGLFSSLWSAGKRLVGNFLRSDTARNLGRQADTFAGDAAKQAAVEGARTLAEKVAQIRLAGVLPPRVSSSPPRVSTLARSPAPSTPAASVRSRPSAQASRG